MAHIYSKSYLMIAASRSNNSSEGFLPARKDIDLEAVSFQDSQGKFQLYFNLVNTGCLNMPEVFEDPVWNEPLSKRAWTLQELLLSKRVLHFGTRNIHWECGEKSTARNRIDSTI